ncbi:hypothetical protein OF83DRAFT_1177433 [Amylostereum chailletii]|nr:hypothetical protein OF83DRAFT_1177433 [Amylostereum chailletii]
MSADTATVAATINYFVPPKDGSKPITTVDRDSNKFSANWETRPHAVSIEDVRGKEDEYTLDRVGFQFFKHPASHTAFKNDKDIEKEYYPESIDFIKQVTGASRVVIFDHTIRRRIEGAADIPGTRQPAAMTHGDQTPPASVARVHRHLPADEVPGLLQKRFQIINLWRPINHPAYDWPLTLCDYRSVDPPRDLVAITRKYPEHTGETYGVQYNEGHKWKYVKGLTPEEGVLIKCFDSIQDGSVAPMTPHTAFEDPTTPAGAPHRESIELRTLVFYD